jgi:hypothetical protein
MSFPTTTDIFPDISTNTITNATTYNLYSLGVVKCQSELNSIVDKQSSPTKNLIGLCWKVHINLSMKVDDQGYGQVKGEATQTYPQSEWPLHSVTQGSCVIYRYHRDREPFDVYNQELGTLGSYTSPWSFAHLPIPTGISIPNGQPFHSNNRVFVTIESLKETLTVNKSYYNPWSVDNFNGGERNVGGVFSREGIIYHNGTNDYNPKLVLADWFPSQDDWKNKNFRGEYLSALVHMVIVG